MRRAAKMIKTGLMFVAYYGFRMRMCDGWTALGFEPGARGEEDYRESLGISRASWYRYIRIGQALHQLSLEELNELPTTNAELLLHVEPELWHEYRWVHEAKTLSSRELAELVIHRNRLIGSQKEPTAIFSVRIPFLAKKAVESMLEGFRVRNDLSTAGQALELFIADHHDRKNVLGGLFKTRQLILGSLCLLKQKKVELGEAGQWLDLAIEVLNESYEEALQGARKETKNVQGGERP